MSSKSIVYIALFLALSIYTAQALECSTPCFASHPNCQTSFCNTDNGVCEDVPRNPLPASCCKSTSDCNTGDPCILGTCDYARNQCQNVFVCDNDSPAVHDNCFSDRDCADDNICTTSKCIDNFCVTSANPDISSSACCQTAADCPAAPCRTAFCTVDTFTCFYEEAPCETDSNQLTELYKSDPVESPEGGGGGGEESPGVGDIIGAIIGFVILGVLIIAFAIVVVLMVIQKIIRKITTNE